MMMMMMMIVMIIVMMMMMMMMLEKKNKTEKYRLSFIDSYRFMLEKLSNLIDNLSGINDTECKKNAWKFRYDRLRYKCEECGNKSSKSSKYRLKKLFTAN